MVRKADVDAPALGNDGATIDVDIVPSPDSHPILITRKDPEESSVSLVWKPRRLSTNVQSNLINNITGFGPGWI